MFADIGMIASTSSALDTNTEYTLSIWRRNVIMKYIEFKLQQYRWPETTREHIAMSRFSIEIIIPKSVIDPCTRNEFENTIEDVGHVLHHTTYGWMVFETTTEIEPYEYARIRLSQNDDIEKCHVERID